MIIKLIDLLNIECAINDMNQNGVKLPFPIAYVLHHNMVICEDISNMFYNRLELVIPKKELMDINIMSEQSKKIYDELLLTELDVDLKPIDIETLINDKELMARVSTIKYLEMLCQGKKH